MSGTVHTVDNIVYTYVRYYAAIMLLLLLAPFACFALAFVEESCEGNTFGEIWQAPRILWWIMPDKGLACHGIGGGWCGMCVSVYVLYTCYMVGQCASALADTIAALAHPLEQRRRATNKREGRANLQAHSMVHTAIHLLPECCVIEWLVYIVVVGGSKRLEFARADKQDFLNFISQPKMSYSKTLQNKGSQFEGWVPHVVLEIGRVSRTVKQKISLIKRRKKRSRKDVNFV